MIGITNNEEKVTIKFGTDPGSNEVDAIAAASSMEAIATMMKEVHKKFNDNHEILVKARPFNKGSFEIPLEVILVAATGMSCLFNSDIIFNILKIIKEYFDIKNQLKGEVPKIVKNEIKFDGNVIKADSITINLLSPSSPANQLVSKAIANASSDDLIKDIQIIKGSDKEEIAKVPKNCFPYYETLQTKIDAPEDQTEHIRATLIIRSAVFEEDKEVKWKFLKNGYKISANIIDEDFLSRVKTGEKFAAGDTLEVELQTRKQYDKMYDEFINPKHTIVKVYGHNKKPGELDLFKNTK